MKYIIFDLEWNQAPDEISILQDPVYLTGEIIEIGAVKLDEHFCPEDELRLFIKPQYYTKLHKRIVSLTGIRDKDLDEKGMTFLDAYDHFVKWCGDEYAFMTWSMSDMPMLIDNMVLHGIDVSEMPECYDIQRIFGREIMRSETKYSLDAALDLLKENGDEAHDALNDARNTAKICSHLELEEYLDEYTSKVFGERPNGKKYESKWEVLNDASLSEFACPWCRQPVKCDQWIPVNGSTYIAYGRCLEGDEFLVQLSLEYHRKTECFVKRIIFEMSDDLWEIYCDKKETVEA